MPRWGWCCRRLGPERPFNYLYLSVLSKVRELIPTPMLNSEPIELSYPEFEAFRLSDLEKLTQEEIVKRVNTSRGTV